MTRRFAIALVPILACLAAGCGSSARPAPAPPVHLSVAGPVDGSTTLDRQVVVRGVAGPGATVLVAGKAVNAGGAGTFSVPVALTPGANVIDVMASSPRDQDAMTAVRVYRQLPLVVPDVAGKSTDAAVREISRLGLQPHVDDSGGFFQSLLPFDEQVCTTEPGAGALLAPGGTVTIVTAKVC